MSDQVHSQIVNEVAEDYGDYELIAMKQGYPGIFEEPVPEHELEGRADLIFSHPSKSEELKIVEAGSVSSLLPEIIEEKYIENVQQAQKHVSYFEDLGYQVEPEVRLKPRGELGALKRIWEETAGVFNWSQAREIIDNDDILSRFKNNETIILDSISKTGSELYTVNEEIDEYGELIDLFHRDVI